MKKRKSTHVEVFAEGLSKGTIRMHPGYTLWCYHHESDELTEAVLQDVPPPEIPPLTFPYWKSRPVPTQRLDIRAGCLWFQALNRKSAERKIKKMFKHVKREKA